jgi:hypothetical protein
MIAQTMSADHLRSTKWLFKTPALVVILCLGNLRKRLQLELKLIKVVTIVRSNYRPDVTYKF